jgi:hypothetical protein
MSSNSKDDPSVVSSEKPTRHSTTSTAQSCYISSSSTSSKSAAHIVTPLSASPNLKGASYSVAALPRKSSAFSISSITTHHQDYCEKSDTTPTSQPFDLEGLPIHFPLPHFVAMSPKSKRTRSIPEELMVASIIQQMSQEMTQRCGQPLNKKPRTSSIHTFLK